MLETDNTFSNCSVISFPSFVRARLLRCEIGADVCKLEKIGSREGLLVFGRFSCVQIHSSASSSAFWSNSVSTSPVIALKMPVAFWEFTCRLWDALWAKTSKHLKAWTRSRLTESREQSCRSTIGLALFMHCREQLTVTQSSKFWKPSLPTRLRLRKTWWCSEKAASWSLGGSHLWFG